MTLQCCSKIWTGCVAGRQPAWEMTFNPPKCYVMGNSQSEKSSTPYFYSMMGQVVAKVNNITYLGIVVYDDLQWETHITGIIAKANRTFGFLRQNLWSCPRQLAELAYFSLISCKLEYASSICDPYLTKDVRQLEAVRFVSKDCYCDSSVTSMLEVLGWDSLETQRADSRLSMLNKILSGYKLRSISKEEQYKTSHGEQYKPGDQC